MPGDTISPKMRLKTKMVVGWCELVDIPSLGLEKLHAKMDSGAATSSIHATRIRPFLKDDEKWVEFWFRSAPGERPGRHEARILTRRMVRSSNGEKQDRYVISAQICLGGLIWSGQLTLANRGSMSFPLLIGRRSLRRGFLVDSSKKWLLGKAV